MYLTLIILPLLGSIASGFFGRKIGVSGSHIISCGTIIVSAFLGILAFIEVGINNIPVTVYVARWVDAEALNVFWCFKFDSLTVSMVLPVLLVSCLVHVYSIGYMGHDPQGHIREKYGDKLSNSGELLKLKIPNDSRKVVSGWSNYSCTAISQKMSENKMDYRGSKSTIVVKEQRIDGSWPIGLIGLRYTLVASSDSTNKKVKIPSNQFDLIWSLIRFSEGSFKWRVQGLHLYYNKNWINLLSNL